MLRKHETVQIKVDEAYFEPVHVSNSHIVNGSHQSETKWLFNSPYLFVQLMQLLSIFNINCVVVLEGVGDTLCNPQAIFDAWLICFPNLLQRTFELGHVKAFEVEGQASQNDSNVWMTPFSTLRWNAFSLVKGQSYAPCSFQSSLKLT